LLRQPPKGIHGYTSFLGPVRSFVHKSKNDRRTKDRRIKDRRTKDARKKDKNETKKEKKKKKISTLR
jgi:hypothetical protein